MTATVHIVSDSRGATALELVKAAAVQFPKGAVDVRCLAHLEDAAQFSACADRHGLDGDTVVFHTVLDPDLREAVRGVLAARHTPSVDLLGPAMAMLSQLLGETPLDIPGLVVDRDFDSVETEDARA